jgi:hypothetical protein
MKAPMSRIFITIAGIPGLKMELPAQSVKMPGTPGTKEDFT